MLVAELDMTFDSDFINGETFSQSISEIPPGGTLPISHLYTWNWIASGASAMGDITVPTPTPISGESSAIAFVSAFLRDVVEADLYEITRNGNNVNIRYPAAVNFVAKFNLAPSHARLTVSVDNQLTVADTLFVKTRSPHIISFASSGLTSVDLDLFVYDGQQGVDRPLNPSYSLSSTAIVVNGVSSSVIDIAALASDFIEQQFDGNYNSNAVWIDYQTFTNTLTGQTQQFFTYGFGVDGYGYFFEGVNPELPEDGVLISNREIHKLDDEALSIPVLQKDVTRVTLLNDNQELYTEVITPTDLSSDIIRYISNSIGSYDNFIERVKADGGEVIESPCLTEVSNCFALFAVDSVIVESVSGITKIDVVDTEEFKYEPHKVTFVNKEGALQDIWFFKRTNESIKTTSKDYKNSLLMGDTFNTSTHQKKVLFKQGNESIEMHSGFYPESHNEMFKQLLLSEDVWVEYGGRTLPVVLDTKSMDMKTHLNDKLISYNIKFEFAFDKINNII